MKIVIVLFLIVILYSLGSALYYMMKNDSSTDMLKALTIRIGLSVGLFLFLVLGFYMGWITPSNTIQPIN